MQADEDDDYIGPAEHVVHYSPMGTFMPVGTYRPIPIVWFAGAWVVQVAALVFLFLLLSSKAALFTIAATALASLGIGHWTFGRGMAGASTAWKACTVVALFFNWAMVAAMAWAMHAG